MGAHSLSKKQHVSRRKVLHYITGLGALTALEIHKAWAEQTASETFLPSLPSVISHPPRTWGPSSAPSYLPDPDVIALDPSFKDLIFFAAPLQRLITGEGWFEGPAWNAMGRFLLLSNTVTGKQYRYNWENKALSIFSEEAYHPNGNTYDYEGRQITCEHGLRRVIRWEHDGSATVLADHYDKEPLNSPNDVVVHPDGSIWFTDPRFGQTLPEGFANTANTTGNTTEHLNNRLGNEVVHFMGSMTAQPAHTFCLTPEGHLKIVLTEEEVPHPNGLCFSPDHKKLYVVSSFKNIRVFNVGENHTLKNGKGFADMTLHNTHLNPDGIRADVQGNIWCGASGPLGVCGVLIYNPNGVLIGHIRLPQGVSNLTFGGPKRNYLYMCAGPSVYGLMLSTQGAGPA